MDLTEGFRLEAAPPRYDVPTYEELRAGRQEAWGQIYELKKQVAALKAELKTLYGFAYCEAR